MRSLDRPVWASLTTHHGPLSEGNALARRYAPDVNVFAAACDETAGALAALAALVHPGQSVLLLQVPDIVVPSGLVPAKVGKGVQMVAARTIPRQATDADILTLQDADAREMLALVRLTEPGPFQPRTHALGTFFGIRIGGRLVAMAGERMRFPGFTEVSAVCTHPDFRGRGLARRLSLAVAAAIAARGDQAFLHAWKSNRAAISLYEALGFRLRAEVNGAELRRSDVAV